MAFKTKYDSTIINLLMITTMCIYRFISVILLFPVISTTTEFDISLVCDKSLSKSFPQFIMSKQIIGYEKQISNTIQVGDDRFSLYVDNSKNNVIKSAMYFRFRPESETACSARLGLIQIFCVVH